MILIIIIIIINSNNNVSSTTVGPIKIRIFIYTSYNNPGNKEIEAKRRTEVKTKRINSEKGN